MTAIELPTPDPRTFDDDTRPFAEAVNDRFAVKRLLGRGGMGMVFLARDRRLDRLVAMKTLPPELAKDAAIRERFLRETRTAGAVSHPNIVPILGADEAGGHVWFTMAFVDGESLAARVRAQGRIEPRAVARYLRDVAAALAHAHARGIVHRDIKAENIMIERATDRALVTDFGIARFAEASPLTVTGQVLGTVHYVSPEQVTGAATDARSDLYSLGVVGFLALTGSFPFDADVASAVLVAHVTVPAPPVATRFRDVPPALAAIIDRCLMKDPAHRFASAEELGAALDAALPTIGTRPVLVSNTEAHQVWQRAAELQARTGLEPRPAAVARPRDAAQDRARQRGYGVGEVARAAEEAGIDATYIEHALVEHGLVPGKGAPAAPPPSVRRGSPPDHLAPTKVSWWTRTPLWANHRVEVEGELRPRDVDRLMNTVRNYTGRLGTAAASTRELSWHTGSWGARLDVTVVPRDGITAIEVTRSMRRRAILTMLATFPTLGVSTGLIVGAILGEGIRVPEPIAVIAGVASGIGAWLWTSRFAMRKQYQRLARRAEVLAEALASKARDSLSGS